MKLYMRNGTKLLPHGRYEEVREWRGGKLAPEDRGEEIERVPGQPIWAAWVEFNVFEALFLEWNLGIEGELKMITVPKADLGHRGPFTFWFEPKEENDD